MDILNGRVFIAFFIALLFLLLLFGMGHEDGLDVGPVGGRVRFHFEGGDKVHVVTGDKVEVVKWRGPVEVLRHEEVLEVKLERVRVDLLRTSSATSTAARLARGRASGLPFWCKRPIWWATPV